MIYVLETLENLIQKYQFFNKENELKDLLYTFKCEKDLDLENFLHNKAIDFEKQNICKTFVLMDTTNLQIIAYFSIALKVLECDSLDISNTQRAKFKIKSKRYTPVFLIGQLAKSSLYKDKINAKEILEYAELIISNARKLVGGNLILVEVKDIEKLIKIYENFAFIQVKKSELIQMIKKF